MTTEAATIGLTHGGSEDTGLGHRGPESKSIVVPYGFWLFVLSDMATTTTKQLAATITMSGPVSRPVDCAIHVPATVANTASPTDQPSI